MLLYSACFPFGDTERETSPSVCAGGVELDGTGWPEDEEKCLIDPSAEMETAVSWSVHAMPQTASE